MLRRADDREIEAVSRESHALWGAGLDIDGYIGLWSDLRATRWGSRWFEHLVWRGDEGILSSLKLYRPLARVHGRDVRVAGIGAVFTPVALRRHGHAAAMIREVIEQARVRGDGVSLLFSDIDAEYYAALGFRLLPSSESWGRLARHSGAAGVRFRPMTPEDLDEVRRMHDEAAASREFAVVRDRDLWEFLIARARGFYSRFDGSDLSGRYRIAMVDGRIAGYLIAVEGHGQWVVREVGAAGADLGLMADILRAGSADAYSLGIRQVYGWFPRDLIALLPEWKIRSEPRRHALPMVLALDPRLDLSGLEKGEGPFIPFLDQF